MIKKIVLFVFVLMMAVVPVVSGDAGFAPEPAEGKYIDITCNVLTPAVEIGSAFIAEVTITNLTNLRIDPDNIEFNGIIEPRDWLGNAENENGRVVDIELAPFESVTIEIESTVLTGSEFCYKEGDNFYVDIQPLIYFYTIDSNGYYSNYYEVSHKHTTIAIENLNDGSEYIALEWLDYRDTLYLFRTYNYKSDDKYYLSEDCIGKVKYSLKHKNISDIKINGSEPGEETILNEIYYENTVYSDIESIERYSYKEFFEVDGKYYCAEAARYYNIEFLNPPELEVEKISNPIFEPSYSVDYTINFTNISNKPVKDLTIFVYTEYNETEYNIDDFYLSCDLGIREICSLNFNMADEINLYDILVGYNLDGTFYYWFIEYNYIEDDENIDGYRYEIGYDLEYMDSVVFDELISIYNNKESESTPTPAPTAIMTVEPTAMPETTETEKIKEAPETTNVPTAKIVERQNPMLWLLIAVLVLSLVAAGLIISVIVKKNNKQ